MDTQTQVIKFYEGNTTTGKQKWDVYFADGTKATAWEYAVAAKAKQAHESGATVVVTIEEKPRNDGGVFRNLKAVNDSHAAGSPASLGGGQPASAPQNGSGGAQGRSQSLAGGGMTPEDKIRVTKLSCISSAAAIFSGSGDVQQTLAAAAEIFNAVMQPAKPEPVAEQPAAPVVPLVQVGTENVVTAAEPKALPWAVA